MASFKTFLLFIWVLRFQNGRITVPPNYSLIWFHYQHSGFIFYTMDSTVYKKSNSSRVLVRGNSRKSGSGGGGEKAIKSKRGKYVKRKEM